MLLLSVLTVIMKRAEGVFRFTGLPVDTVFLPDRNIGDILKKLLAPKIRRRLSLSLLEVLAVIAYNQPVTRGRFSRFEA